jgi:ketosteroid isomerase-like protein
VNTTLTHSTQDQLDIQKIIHRYAKAMDSQQWQLLDTVFVEEAVADYQAIGECHGRRAITDLVAKVLVQCKSTQHLIGNIDIELDGDKAQSSCYLLATHIGKDNFDGEIYTVWGEYRDQLIRTADGWRIIHRTLIPMHIAGDIGIQL